MSDLNKLKEASKEYLSTLAAHRKNPRSYDAVDAWDKASSNFAEITKNNELDIIASLINQLETEEVHRKGAFLACNAWHDKFRKSEKYLEAAEAEIARRDATAGEPFMYGIMTANGDPHFEEFCVSSDPGLLEDEIWEWNNGLADNEPKNLVVPLYTAAQPSALPPQKDSLSEPAGDRWSFAMGYNQAIADAKALGCKAIKLPEPYDDGHGNEWLPRSTTIQSLKAQGFKVE